MIDRPHLEIDRLEAAEGAFGGRELFVGGDRRGLIQRRFGDCGAHHIDAVECRFGVDFGGVARKGETVVGDIQIKMFGHFVFVDDAADRERNLVFAAQRLFGAMNAGRNGGEFLFGGGQQVFALAGALVRQQRIAAGDEALARIIRRRTRSAASAGSRSALFSAQRYSTATFWPTT